jgi:hypothetical protein
MLGLERCLGSGSGPGWCGKAWQYDLEKLQKLFSYELDTAAGSRDVKNTSLQHGKH